MENIKTQPLMENESVRELLSILKENRAPTMQDLLDVLNHVAEMERQFGEALNELQAIRQELSASREQNHPAKATLQNAVKAVESNIAVLRERLDAIRQSVIDGCRNAVSAFKEKGITALDDIARFFKIRPILESMHDNLTKTIQTEDKAIATIEAVSAEYHQAERHVKNIFRAVAGKDAVQDVRAAGRLAQALRAPVQSMRSAHVAMKNTVEATIGKLVQLERTAERKPSVEKAMRSYREQAQKAPKAPAPAIRRDAR